MSDATSAVDPSHSDTTTTQPTETQQEPKTVPLSALQEERKRAADLKAKLDAIEAANAEQARKAAEAQGEFERLYRETLAEAESLRPLKAEIETVRQREAQARDARWQKLPKALQATRLDGLTAEQDAKLLEAQEAIAAGLTAEPKGDPTARAAMGGGDPSQLTDAERAWVDSEAGRFARQASIPTIRKAYQSYIKRNPTP